MSCSICLEGFCADPEANYVFFWGGKQGCFLGKFTKSDILNFGSLGKIQLMDGLFIS